MRGILHLRNLFALGMMPASSEITCFQVSFHSNCASISSYQRLPSCLMTKEMHSGKQQWLSKPKFGAGHVSASDIASCSSQVYANLSLEVSKKKLAGTRKHDLLVDQLVEVRLELAGTDMSKDVSSKKKEHRHKGKKGDTGTPKKVKGTVTQAQLRATFHPKFENEKFDQEEIIPPIELCSFACENEVVGARHGVLEVRTEDLSQKQLWNCVSKLSMTCHCLQRVETLIQGWHMHLHFNY